MKGQLIKKARFAITVTILLLVMGCSKDNKPADQQKKSTPQGIVYTYAGDDSVMIDSSRQTYALDMDKDGNNDIQFGVGEEKCGEDLGPTVKIMHISALGYASSLDGIYFASPLDSGAVIDSSSLWANNQWMLRGAVNAGYIRCMISEGQWYTVSNRFLGIKFLHGSDTLYGWMRISSSYRYVSERGVGSRVSVGQLKLTDFAYNSTPGQPIFAGQKK